MNPIVNKTIQNVLELWMLLGSALGLFLLTSAQSINDILISFSVIISALVSRGLFQLTCSIIESRITSETSILTKGNEEK